MLCTKYVFYFKIMSIFVTLVKLYFFNFEISLPQYQFVKVGICPLRKWDVETSVMVHTIFFECFICA